MAEKSSFTGERRDDCVDTARGIACILLVAFHAIGSHAAVGLSIGDSSGWRFFADLLGYVRMPMFTFLSGYVYAWKPFAGNGRRFLSGKARRLLVPMLVVGTVFAILQSLVPGSHEFVKDWWTLHIVPVAHYWFLESLFLIFVAVMILEPAGLLRSPIGLAFVLAAAVAMHVTNQAPNLFGLEGAVYLFPYFLCGLACCRFRMGEKSGVLPVAVVFLAAFGYAAAGMSGYVAPVDKESIVGLIAGVSASFVVVRSGWKNRILMIVGASSYAIYLFHVFFTAAMRGTLYRLQVQNLSVLVAAVTIAGLLGPILLERIADHFALSRTLLLGKAWSPSKIRPD